MTSEMIMFKNLSCRNCAAELEKVVQALPGMKSARIVFGAGSLNVEYDEEMISQERIVSLTEQMGLDIAAIVPSPATTR